MNYQVGQVVKVTTGEVAHGGWCVARPDDGPVIFVRHALPGETVLARLTDVTSRLARAEAVEIMTPSPDRVEPPCPYARPCGCGGCDWQHAALPAQRSLKAAVIRQQLRRLAGLDCEVTVEPLPGEAVPGETVPGETVPGEPVRGEPVRGEPVRGEPVPGEPGSGVSGGLGWRTRVQFAVRPDGVAGLRAHRSHQVMDVGRCLIAHPALTDLGLLARRWPATASVEAVVAAGSGERAVIITGSAGPRKARSRHGGLPPTVPPGRPGSHPGLREPARLPDPTDRPAPRDLPDPPDPIGSTGLPGADSVLRRSGPLKPSNRRLTAVRGRPYLRQRAAGRDWRVSAGVFWQVHPGAADVLTAAVLTALDPSAGDVALDLYCGAGLFAGALAPAVGPGGTVIGLEADPAAVRDARHNLRDWPWARVRKGDVAALLRGGGRREGLPAARLVVADPPRAGLAREVVGYLSAPEHGPTRFAYVSCDPATLARDIGLLLARGWTLDDLRAFDAFPMTHHVECVATLVKSRA